MSWWKLLIVLLPWQLILTYSREPLLKSAHYKPAVFKPNLCKLFLTIMPRYNPKTIIVTYGNTVKDAWHQYRCFSWWDNIAYLFGGPIVNSKTLIITIQWTLKQVINASFPFWLVCYEKRRTLKRYENLYFRFTNCLKLPTSGCTFLLNNNLIVADRLFTKTLYKIFFH